MNYIYILYINIYTNFQLVSTIWLSSRKFIEILITHLLDSNFDFTNLHDVMDDDFVLLFSLYPMK